MTYIQAQENYLEQLTEEHKTITKTLNIALRYFEGQTNNILNNLIIDQARALQNENIARVSKVKQDLKNYRDSITNELCQLYEKYGALMELKENQLARIGIEDVNKEIRDILDQVKQLKI